MTVRARTPRPSGVDEHVDDVLASWLTQHAVTMLATVGLVILRPSGAWLALAAAASFADLWYRTRAQHEQLRPYGGLANRLTAVRLGLVLLASACVETLPVAWLCTLLAANVAIDAGDGYVARRRKEAAPFGAVFDREVDSVFVLAAYQYFFLVSGLPAWVLMPGALPYLFRLAAEVLPDAPSPQHRERLAPLFAGANFVVLLIAVALPPPAQPYAVAVSVVLVGASFSISFAKLLRHEHSIP